MSTKGRFQTKSTPMKTLMCRFVFLVLGAISAFAGSAGAGQPARTDDKPPAPGKAVWIANPYAQVEWDKVECLHSFSHQHGNNPEVFWDMGFRHLPLSNYYPSRPIYPLPDAFAKAHPDAFGAPNAEQHSTTDSGVHFNAVGSLYTTGYGETPRFKMNTAPLEHVFTHLNVFDPQESPWRGVYRLDLSIAASAGTDQTAAVSLTVEGATEVGHKTFARIGDGIVRERRLTEKFPGAIYLKTHSDKVRVRLDFDPASTRITRFRLMQGTNRPWRAAFRAALDGTLKDAAGRPVEGLLFPEGGGITLNHPRGALAPMLEMLDFDARVLGIEVWNQHTGFGVQTGGTAMGYYQLWDGILSTGRRCYGFFVKDHLLYGRGRNVLLVAPSGSRMRSEREREALRAYREGRFFGLLGAMTVDASGKVTAPYDNSAFRFTCIAVKENQTGQPVGVEVSVDGADRGKRPNTQIRFVTEAGVTHVANGDRAHFEFPCDAVGTIRCRYVRVEAFAYPHTHLGGRPLTAAVLTAMNVHEIARLHDRLGDLSPDGIDPAGQAPIPIVDMLFSQPILVRESRTSP